MKHKILVLVFYILAGCTLPPLHAQNGKKIYADYHGTRYTRLHDGMLGRWSYYADTERSATATKRLCYNADIILENGLHDIAAVAYPLVGIQSAIDPDFIEYEILSAKAAGIDGFFIEWGYPEHESDLLLRAMQSVARKYNFEIGVNWCDGWLYYDWITKQNPAIRTREDKTLHFRKCMQYLIDHVLSVPTAPVVNGKPVMYLFGAGITPDEYREVIAPHNFNIPAGSSFPQILRRVAEWGELNGDKYIPAPFSPEAQQWIALGMVPSAWIPARVRLMNDAYPHWDKYGTCDDAIEFLRPFQQEVWENDSYPLKTGFVTPGMDNRGCAGWGWSHFYLIPRDNGATYDRLWQMNMESKDHLDMMFIASWSDYTEGHEIEPTIENGDRELRTTLKYASEFKDLAHDESGISLPQRLFELRKRTVFLKECGRSTRHISSGLNEIAHAISNANYKEAARMLNKQEKYISKEEKKLNRKTYNSPDLYSLSTAKSNKTNGKNRLKEKSNGSRHLDIQDSIFISLTPDLRKELQENNYKGYITFEYLDEGIDRFVIRSATNKQPSELFSVVADIQCNQSNNWKKAKVELFKPNIAFSADADFVISGKGKIRNIVLSFDVYK